VSFSNGSKLKKFSEEPKTNSDASIVDSLSVDSQPSSGTSSSSDWIRHTRTSPAGIGGGKYKKPISIVPSLTLKKQNNSSFEIQEKDRLKLHHKINKYKKIVRKQSI
jgi:hypothetical protein